MNEKERLLQLMQLRGFKKKKELANYLGIKDNTLSNWFSRGTLDANLVASRFTDVNLSWLLTGEGEMLKKEYAGGCTNLTRSYDVPLLPIYAKGGTLSDFAFSVMSWECERIMCPIQDAHLAMSITGDSMEPEYPSGSYVFIKKVNENSFIEWGKVYVLDTCNGAILKRVYPGKRDDLLLCKSNNADYPDFEVNRSDVFGLYRVLLMMALK